MRSRMRWVWPSIALIFQLGCSDDGKEAALDVGVDAADPSDAGRDEALDRDPITSDITPDIGPDVDIIGDNYGLIALKGVRACSSDWVLSDDLTKVRANKGRITFRVGTHVLFKDQTEFELDLIEALEFGANRTKVTPPAAGRVVRKDSTTAEVRYVFTQQLDVDGSSVEIQMSMGFSPEAERVKTLDVGSLSNKIVSLQVSHEGWNVQYGPCEYSAYACTSQQFELAGNDVLVLESCGHCPDEWMCKSNLGGIARARFSRSSVVRELFDHFNLAHSFRHHNWGQDSLVIFDQPVDAVHGIYLGTEQYPNHFGYKTARYLDANLQEIESREVIEVKPASW